MAYNNSLNYQPTQHDVLIGGANGQIASISPSTSGYVLTSNGSTSNPSFQVNASISAFTSINVQAFTYTGSIQTYTPTSGMKYCIIECVGGGGGGAGCPSTGSTQVAAGSGGGAGGYSRTVASAATVGGSQTVTIGSGGSGGIGNNPGMSGGNTSVGSICVAGGASGGLNGAGSATTCIMGGNGGSGGSGDLIPNGQNGGGSFGVYQIGNSSVCSGFGGNSIYGAGGLSVATESSSTQSIGDNGSDYGGGGSGAISQTGGTAATGGNGANGLVIITEYIS